MERAGDRNTGQGVRVTAYLGLGSSYSYLAATQLPGLEARSGVGFDWQPINSVALIRRVHGSGGPFDGPRLRGSYDPAYRERDARRWATHYGVPYHEPQIADLPPDAMALACWAAPDPAARAAMMTDLYGAIFAKGRVMDLDRLAGIAADHGVSDATFREALQGGGAHDRHEAALDAALAAGVFGVPTFVVGDALFWGNDRLALLEDHLRQIR